YGCEVLDAVIRKILIERRIDRMRGVAKDQRVAIRRRLAHESRPDAAAGARPVLDDDGLAKVFRQLFADDTGKIVDATARCPGNDQLDRTRRVLLRGCDATVKRRSRDQQCKAQPTHGTSSRTLR